MAVKKLTPEEFGHLMNRAEETALYLRDAVKRWNLMDPPAGLERAALTLNSLNEANAELQRAVLAHVANAADRRELLVELAKQP